MTEPGPLFVSSDHLIADRRYDAAMDLASRGDVSAAADIMAQTISATPGFAAAWFALGAIRARLGDRQRAVAAFTEASRADPEDYHGARLQLARLGADDSIPAMTESFLRRLFDQDAARYDTALTERLRYRGPAILRDAVKSALHGLRRPMRFEALLGRRVQAAQTRKNRDPHREGRAGAGAAARCKRVIGRPDIPGFARRPVACPARLRR